MDTNLIISIMMLIASVCMIIGTMLSYSEIKFTGEVKFKGLNLKKEIIALEMIFLLIIIVLIFIDNSNRIIFSLWQLILLSTIVTNGIQKYLVSTEGIVLPNECRKFEFFKWEDILELRNYRNRRIELVIINDQGKKVRKNVILRKKDYNDIIEFINQNI
ncbi:hypothetical protein [Oceanirhabdus sp. W0125-5]|uniref:hypothetical protein n=1 Tax=Oceanirhabdus sp. W0125-5 TaxID=2999116 RepID=UPI0022F2D844|nr:hypothetical protein [Oceanirhabdus sp. W0125-5]WBW94707.1 hypothetical protein OW730_13480 [Oceanirhabdus sp. W0125-5]